MRLWSMGGLPGGRSAAAMMPTLPVTPRATTYRQVVIYGQPGTMGVPAPKPGVIPSSGTRVTQPSYCSPDVIFPSLYITTPENMHPPVSLFRDNQMPVPAVGNFGGVGRLAPQSFKRRGVGGQKQIAWPAVVQQFPSLRGSRFSVQ